MSVRFSMEETILKVYWEYRYLRGEGLVKMFFVQGIPFTWDDVAEFPLPDKVIRKARESRIFSPEDIWHGSSYLMEEGFHPLLDELDLDELSELPH